MGDVVDFSLARARLTALRALERESVLPVGGSMESVTIAAADLPALADYAKPQWPGWIDDLEV